MDRTAVKGKAALAEEETRLVRSAAAGDGSAFAVLYRRYEKRAFNFAYRLTGSEADAVDAVEAAFLETLLRMPRVADREPGFGSHLFAATRSACHALMHKRAPAPPSEAIPATPQEEVREANARLPERQREVLALRDLEELGYEEIAAIMEVSAGTVAQLISRARINLRDEMRGTALASVAPSPQCERALSLIAARDDDQLEAASADATWLQSHLEGCDRCRLATEAMREANASYRAWAPIAAVPWMFEETMAKAAQLTGGDWSAATAGVAAAKRPRRRVTLAAGLAALLLLAGAVAVIAGSDPGATPTDSATGAAPRRSATAPRKSGGSAGRHRAKRHAATAKKKSRAPSGTAPQSTAAETTPAPTSTPAAAEAGAPSRSASGTGHPAGETASQPTKTSSPKSNAKPKPAPAPVPSPTTSTSTPTPAPATTPTAPAEAPPAEESTPGHSHEHEPPGKPADRPPK